MKSAMVWRSALGWIAILLLIAAAGCASKHGKQKATAAQPGADSSAAKTMATSAGGKSGTASKSSATHHEAAAAGPSNHVRLVQHSCIQFEPQWCDIQLGQPLVWTSELKTPVTIHVSGSAFDKAEYVVRPGATLSTGPARAAGSYSIWSEPAACQGAPLGARGSGPGVTVESSAKH
jgi:plastocyanin